MASEAKSGDILSSAAQWWIGPGVNLNSAQSYFFHERSAFWGAKQGIAQTQVKNRTLCFFWALVACHFFSEITKFCNGFCRLVERRKKEAAEEATILSEFPMLSFIFFFRRFDRFDSGFQRLCLRDMQNHATKHDCIGIASASGRENELQIAQKERLYVCIYTHTYT